MEFIQKHAKIDSASEGEGLIVKEEVMVSGEEFINDIGIRIRICQTTME